MLRRPQINWDKGRRMMMTCYITKNRTNKYFDFDYAQNMNRKVSGAEHYRQWRAHSFKTG